MAFAVDPTAPIDRALTRVVRARLRKGIRLLDRTDPTDELQVAHAAHEVRKRCKEVRAAARLVRPSLGDDFDLINTALKDAAAALAPIRDAHATSLALDRLVPPTDGEHSPHDPSPADVDTADRLAEARELLRTCRSQVKRWDLADDARTFESGLRATYRRGRKGLRRIGAAPDDEQSHEWRKAVKQLWYQVRLLERAAPSVLVPLRGRLDDLHELLGDDHDLTVLIEALTHDPVRYGGEARATEIRRVAEREQQRLRSNAQRLGATLYSERPDAFAARVVGYWNTTRRLGAEPTTPLRSEPVRAQPPMLDNDDARPRNRRFLVARTPVLDGPGIERRLGYLAIDGTTMVWVTDNGTPTLQLTAGHRGTRLEWEWAISADDFATAWDTAEGRRLRSTSYRVPLDAHTAEVVVFHDALEGLLLVEVEFGSIQAMVEFMPPDWFGPEVTDDDSFSPAALAVNALPGAR